MHGKQSNFIRLGARPITPDGKLPRRFPAKLGSDVAASRIWGHGDSCWRAKDRDALQLEIWPFLHLKLD
jgi:hypothetical protein